jgi:peptide deformylase
MIKPLPLITYPNPILKQKSQPVLEINQEIKNLAERMFSTMYHQGGIGLAAVQVGVLKRIIVCDLTYEIENHHHHHHHHENCHHDLEISNSTQQCFINPIIISSSAKTAVCKEGCLSFPNIKVDVIRPETVVISYLDLEGKQQQIELTDLASTCIQHEIDHLNGIVFVDYLSKLKKDILLKKLLKNGKL